VYGKTRKEAQDKLRKLQAEVVGGLLADTQRRTVAEYLRQWLETAIVCQDAARRALARPWKGGLRRRLRWSEFRGATGALDV
jgi:hypothetical protein